MANMYYALMDEIKRINMAQYISNDLTKVLYTMCLVYNDTNAVAKEAKRYLKSKRAPIMHKRLCLFVLEKFKEYYGADEMIMTGIALDDAKTEDQLIQVDAHFRGIMQRHVTEQDIENVKAERARAAAELKERIHSRAKTLEAFRTHKEALVENGLKSKYAEIYTNKALSQAVLGMTPSEFKRINGLPKRVSARDYMDVKQLNGVTLGLDGVTNFAHMSERNMNNYLEKTKTGVEHIDAFCEITHIHVQRGAPLKKPVRAGHEDVKYERENINNERLEEVAMGIDRPRLSDYVEHPEHVRRGQQARAAAQVVPGEIRAVNRQHPLYNDVVAVTRRRSGTWMNNDEPVLDISDEDISSMYHGATPCEANQQGLLIMSTANNRFKVSYNA